MDTDPLSLTREQMLEMAELTAAMLVERIADLRSEPVLRRATPDEMERRLAGPPPNGPRPYRDILGKLESDVLPFGSHIDHPAYFAFIPTSGTFPGALGDLIASALNVYVGSWMEGAGLTRLEQVVIDWFKDWVGYPNAAAGIMVSGGSAANLTALACAREALAGPMREDLVGYVSDQGHSSVARAARALGFRHEQFRVLPADSDLRLRPDALAAAMAADRAAGLTPLVVSASAGSTNTGAVDPLAEIAQVCHDHDAWLHVDAAYGGFAVLTERGKGWLEGIELADSITLDPHKWLYQSYECGCLLVREGRLLREAFEITPDYLRDAETALREVNFADQGLQLSRTSRALKVWISVNAFGLDAFREAIDRSLDLAREAQAWIERSDKLEVLLPAQLGVVCFRRRLVGGSEPEIEALNRGLVAELERSGEGLVSSTRLHGRYAIRLCVLNHTSDRSDVERVLSWLADADAATAIEAAGSTAAEPDRDPHRGAAPERGLAGPVAEALAGLPLLASLTGEQINALARDARISVVDAGEPVVTRWDSDQDFFVVIDGTVSVEIDGRQVQVLGPGEFFGELGAIDWGAGYTYPRLATVVATEPSRLLVIGADAFNGLMSTAPAFAQRIRTAVAERLPGPKPPT